MIVVTIEDLILLWLEDVKQLPVTGTKKQKAKTMIDLLLAFRSLFSLKIRAEEEIRTPKPFQALPPQSSASTSFATSANFGGQM